MAWLIPQRLLQTPDAQLAERNGEYATLVVQGLVCTFCARRVTASLNRLDGVESVSCNLDSGTATLQIRGDLGEETLRAAVIRAAVAMPLRRVITRLAARIGFRQ